MKVNYPIKYATMPIIEQVGWVPGFHEMERDYDVVCYIVSKCYLISDLTKYKENGAAIREYEVVFPYQPSEFSRWKRVTPEYNLIHGHSTNSNKVDKVFDSYEEALIYATEKNEKLCEKTWVYLPCSKDIMEKIQEKKDEFDAKLSEYKVLEEQILLNTSDMIIGKNRKLNNVVRYSNNEAKVLQCSIYGILQLFDNEKFVVYSISDEQYNNLTKLISEGKKETIKSLIGQAKCLLTHREKNSVIKLAIEEVPGVYYFKNNSIIYDEQLGKVIDDDFKNLDEDTLVFYTTETIDDLMNSYKKYPEINLRELGESSIKKVKKHK